jgi:DNA-binding transcriptional MerR regulator
MRLRIDELAHRAGTTSRNIRAYQARGLLPPPQLEARTGYYDEEHLRRLEIIDELQRRGFSLEAIRHTLDAWSRGGDLSQLLGFRHVVSAPFTDEEPARFTMGELVERFPEATDDPGVVARAVELELLEPTGDGAFEAPSPMLIEAGAELVRAGVPLTAVFDLVEAVRVDLADVARRFVELARDHIFGPLVEGEAVDEDDAAEALETLRTLRPIALEVVRPFLAQEMRRAIEDALRQFGGQHGADGALGAGREPA